MRQEKGCRSEGGEDGDGGDGGGVGDLDARW